jgi:hypothetical protein
MSDREIIAELVHGDRNIIEDAEAVEQRDTFAVEARHTDETGASVILSFDLTSAWRSDSESEPMREFDLWSADPELSDQTEAEP